MKKWMLLFIIVVVLAHPKIIDSIENTDSFYAKAADDIELDTINLNKDLIEKGYATLYKNTKLIPPKFRTSPDTWPYSILKSEVDAKGICTHVVDGDTIDVEGVGRVRLAAINTPEKGEPGYQEAKNYVIQVCLHKMVYLDIDPKMDQDRYGRILAMVYISNENTTNTQNQSSLNYTNETQPTGMGSTGASVNETQPTGMGSTGASVNETQPTGMPSTGAPIPVLALGILAILSGIAYGFIKK